MVDAIVIEEYTKEELFGYQLHLPNQFPPDFKEEFLSAKPMYGVLEKLVGTWVNYNPTGESKYYGIQNSTVPSPGSCSETLPGVFHFLCSNYNEELTFKLIPGKVRNRGGTNEQLTGCVEYAQKIIDVNGTGLHEENGMFIYMRDMSVNAVNKESIAQDYLGGSLALGEKANLFYPQHSICRMGTIPHGNNIQLLGSDYVPKEGKPNFPRGDDTWEYNHITVHPTMGIKLHGHPPVGPHNLDTPPPAWCFEELEPGGRQYVQRIFSHDLYPYSVRPEMRLRDAIEGQNIRDHIVIDLCSKYDVGPQGTVTNTPMVAKYCPVTEMKFRMWIETVIEDGEEILQLQYEQIVFFEFSPFFDGSIARWPHIQVNTLRLKSYVDAKLKK